MISHNRYVIYSELLPIELINNQPHDSNRSAVLALHEMKHFKDRYSNRARQKYVYDHLGMSAIVSKLNIM